MNRRNFMKSASAIAALGVGAFEQAACPASFATQNAARLSDVDSANERFRFASNQNKEKPVIVDVHGHLWLKNAERDKVTNLRICSAYNIKKLFISTLNGYYPDETEVRSCNETTFGFMKERPNLIKGLAYLNPANPNCVNELERCVNEFGMCGIKLWVATFCDDERVNPIAEAAIKYDIPIEVHCFKKTVGQLEHETTGIHVENLGKRYPELKIIMAHIGSNVYDTVKCIKEYDNIFADFSGSVMRRDDLDYTIRHIGVQRLLFGSDMPGSFDDCVGQVEGAAITDEERKMIYCGNACKLFKMEDMES